ncbi:MAG: hypothetical protein ABSA77_08460 [Thermoguttaceae bacterium]|jgi:hypothetical protein
MSSMAITTIVKMMETLPESAQNLMVERLREYIAEVQDEELWEAAFQKTQKGLIAAARSAKQEIAEGHSEPMDYNRL